MASWLLIVATADSLTVCQKPFAIHKIPPDLLTSGIFHKYITVKCIFYLTNYRKNPRDKHNKMCYNTAEYGDLCAFCALSASSL